MLRRTGLFDEMYGVFRRFDNLFRRMMEETGWPAGGRLLPSAGTETALLPASTLATPLSPAVEVLTRDDQLVVRAELPGVDSDDIEVTVVDDRLVIRGEKKEQREERGEDRYIQEVQYGRFERSFALPEGAKTDKIEASFHNGILEVTVPAEGLPAAKKVPIRVLPSGKSDKDKKVA